MRKFFFGILAIVAMVATSCQQDAEFGVNSGDLATVSINLATPQIATKAKYSEGTLATHLQYAVYAVAGEEGAAKTYTHLPALNGENTQFPGSDVVEFQLTTGNTYAVVFWAGNDNAPYTITFGQNGAELSINYANRVCNEEILDAFFKTVEFTVKGGMQPVSAELRRPFAQLNIGANDYVASANAGYTVSHATVTVPAYSGLDLISGNVIGNKEVVTFGWTAKPEGYEFPVSGYEYLAMNYILMDKTKEDVDVVFSYATKADGSDAKTRTVGSVPVQRNHRTNLYGQLFTTDVDVNVVVKPEYEDPAHNVLVSVANAVELIKAVKEIKDGDEIVLTADFSFSTEEGGYSDNGGWRDGLGYSGDKSFTLNLNGHTLGNENGALNDYLLWFKNDGEKANTITIKNGTLDAGTTAFSAVATSSSNKQSITIDLENVTLINNISNGAVAKIRSKAVLNVKAGTKIIGKNSYTGIECVGSTTNIYEGAEIYQNGTSSSWGFLAGASWGGVINVYGGKGVSARGCFMAMTSGGTINVHGGEWTANVDGTIGNNSNLYVLTAQNNKYESGYTGASIINVTGGTFRGGMDAWVLNDPQVEKAELNISGGNFNANPTRYLVDATATENNGIWTVE